MKKSALSVALSSKPGDQPAAEKKDIASDTFSFPCLTPSGAKTDSNFDDEFEQLKLSDTQLAGSISNNVMLPNGSLAVSSCAEVGHACLSLALPSLDTAFLQQILQC